MAFGGPEACGRSTRGRLPGSSYLDLPPKCSQYGILWPTKLDRLREKRVRAHLVQTDVREMPFPDRSFDLVVDFGVCYHVNHPTDALKEIARVLDTSSTFAYETPLAQHASAVYS